MGEPSPGRLQSGVGVSEQTVSLMVAMTWPLVLLLLVVIFSRPIKQLLNATTSR